MAVMAKKPTKANREPNEGTSKRPGFKQLGFQLDEDIAAAIQSFMSQQEIPTTHIWTPFFRKAAIEYLTKRGFWPPKTPGA